MSVIQLFQEPRPANVLIRALKALLDAPTRAEAEQALMRDRSLLLSDAAVQILHDLWSESMSEGWNHAPYANFYVKYHHRLLKVAKEQGVERGWAAADAMVSSFGGSRDIVRTLTDESFRDLLRSKFQWRAP